MSVKFAFGEPPQEAVDYFEAKKLGDLYAFDYRDAWKEEHVNNFVVAKAAQLDVLTTLHEAVHEAISKGVPFSEFKKNLQPKLEELGWWGRQAVNDPKTGAEIEAQLGSPQRLRTIYDTNVGQAYNAGKWQRAEATKRAMPYLLYRLGASAEHRPEHASWDGICLPVGDTWWDMHMPKNGWGCQCWVQQITQYQYDKYLTEGLNSSVPTQEINPETGLPTGHITRNKIQLITTPPKVEYMDWLNKRTGKVEKVPAGIDPGFDFNPGKKRFENLLNMVNDKVQSAPPQIQKPFVGGFIRTYSNLYLAATDVTITAQNAIAKQMFAYWIKVFNLLLKK